MKNNLDSDLSIVDTIVTECGRTPDSVIPILQKLQAHYRYLPEAALHRVCELTEITPASIAGVSTFYSQFRQKPVGRHIISICHGTACHVKGADHIHDALTRHLGIEGGADTDPAGLFTLERVACLGCCTLAPVIKIDQVTYGHLTPETVPRAVEDFLELEQREVVPRHYDPSHVSSPGLTEIRIGVGSCCVAGGSQAVRQELEDEVRKLGAAAVIKPVGCVGMCHQTPLVEIVSAKGEPVTYAKVRPEDAAQLVRRHFKPQGLARRLRSGVTDSGGTDKAALPSQKNGRLPEHHPPGHITDKRRRRLVLIWRVVEMDVGTAYFAVIFSACASRHKAVTKINQAA